MNDPNYICNTPGDKRLEEAEGSVPEDSSNWKEGVDSWIKTKRAMMGKGKKNNIACLLLNLILKIKH